MRRCSAATIFSSGRTYSSGRKPPRDPAAPLAGSGYRGKERDAYRRPARPASPSTPPAGRECRAPDNRPVHCTNTPAHRRGSTVRGRRAICPRRLARGIARGSPGWASGLPRGSRCPAASRAAPPERMDRLTLYGSRTWIVSGSALALWRRTGGGLPVPRHAVGNAAIDVAARAPTARAAVVTHGARVLVTCQILS